MDLRNCTKCGRAFAFTGLDVCSRCSTDDEADFRKVKEYLYDHPGATVTEVSEETGVSERQILRYLRESRIEIREENNCLLHCERCDKSIRSGRFCDECAAALKKEFKSVLKPPTVKEAEVKQKDRTGTKMHIVEMRKK
ncbi:TIGR03826 family flagellar region protein [Alkaliphilus transvaalensis]|uniref:TIGR03826 family flagellar region protein n=1 Tax=Alkaliphilus transvaalensis TaxID=114628 RepID=UPI00047AE342|nr:TIGR03826 family flagellar region protein [Alkaliphilus transvaalensis]